MTLSPELIARVEAWLVGLDMLGRTGNDYLKIDVNEAEEIATDIRAFLTAAQGQEWWDIEAEVTDRLPVLIACWDENVPEVMRDYYVAYQEKGRWFLAYPLGMAVPFKPTHWRPLSPPNPSAAEG